MVTTYIPRKPKKDKTPAEKIIVPLNQNYPIGAQIKDAAEAIKLACLDLFKKEDPYPTVRMVKFKEDEIIYEITTGKGSRAKVGCV